MGAKPAPTATEAKSPDGRRVARVALSEGPAMTQMDEDWFAAVVTVDDVETGRRIHEERFECDQYGGHRVVGIAFDADGTLLAGLYDGGTLRIEMPAHGELSAWQARPLARAAVVAAFGERAPVLVDVLDGLFFTTEPHLCQMCTPYDGTSEHDHLCDACRGRLARRAAESAPPNLAMALADATRAIHAHASDPEVLVAVLTKLATRVPAKTPCRLCRKDPPLDALDYRSVAGRVCAGCVRARGRPR